MDFRPLIAQHVELRRGRDRRHDSGAPARCDGARHHAGQRASAGSRASSRSRRIRPCSMSLVMPPPLCQRARPRAGRARSCSSRRWASTSSTATCSSTLLDNDLADFGKHIIPGAIRIAPRLGVRLPGLLGGHRHDPRLLRGQSRPRVRAAAVQFLRHDRADLHAPALSAGVEDQRRPDRPRDHLRRLHHHARRHPPVDRRHPQHRPARGAPAPDDHARHATSTSRPRRSPSTKRWGTRASASARTRDRERDHRQERPHRQRRHHHAARQARPRRSRRSITSATAS